MKHFFPGRKKINAICTHKTTKQIKIQLVYALDIMTQIYTHRVIS